MTPVERLRQFASRRVTLGAVLLITLVTLVVAAGLKSYCLTDQPPGYHPQTCYNDVQTLWEDRDMAEHRAPYSSVPREVRRDGKLVAVDLGAGQIEYPVLTGVFAWVTALPARTTAGYLVWNSIALIPLALLTSLLLFRLTGRRAMLFAASPQLAAYAFLNWDLLPVLATALGLWAWRRDRHALAGAAFALGACAKLWPGFVLVPLLLALVLARRWRPAATVASAAVLSAVAVNLPFMLANFRGWLAPYLMQSVRLNDPTTNSVWYKLFSPTDFGTVNRVSALAILIGWTLALGYGVRRWQASGEYPWVQVAASMVAGYIVLGRVDSPQYALWLLPFLALIAVPWAWIGAFSVINILLWLQWSFLWSLPWSIKVPVIGLNGLMLAGLAVVLLRSPLAVRDWPGIRPLKTAAVIGPASPSPLAAGAFATPDPSI